MSNAEILTHAAVVFHPALMSILYNIAEAPRPQPTCTTVYDSGEEFGHPWPLIHVRGADIVEYGIAITPSRPDMLTIGRNPVWPNGDPEIEVALDDPALIGKILWLTNWTVNALDCDLPCWGDAESRAKLRAEFARDEA